MASLAIFSGPTLKLSATTWRAVIANFHLHIGIPLLWQAWPCRNVFYFFYFKLAALSSVASTAQADLSIFDLQKQAGITDHPKQPFPQMPSVFVLRQWPSPSNSPIVIFCTKCLWHFSGHEQPTPSHSSKMICDL